MSTAAHWLLEMIVACRRCPRLMGFRKRVVREKLSTYRQQE